MVRKIQPWMSGEESLSSSRDQRVRADHILKHRRKLLGLVFAAEPGLLQAESSNVEETDPPTLNTLQLH